MSTASDETYVAYKVYELNIKGVVFYTDEHRNLFHIMDVIHRIPNPRIIGKWTVSAHGETDVILELTINNGR